MTTALFVAAHPDDESLMSGVAIVEHAAAGIDVHVLVISPSVSSTVLGQLNGAAGSSVAPWWGVVHNPTAEGYAPLTEDLFGQARLDETAAACRAMGSGLGTITLHSAGLGGGWTAADAQALILDVANSITPGPVLLKTHSHIVDDHPDHIATGQGARLLAAADPTRFGNLRHYILPRYWADPRLSNPAVVEHWDDPTNAAVAARATNGLRSYGAWHPPASYAIGYHSVYSDMFAPLLGPAGPKCMYHS